VTLFDLPHDEARRLARSGAPVFLLVNPVEYHGPHLSLHNDRLIANGLTRDVHARLAQAHPEWPLVIGADLELGVDPAAGPGTRHTPSRGAVPIIAEACRALCELGATRVVLMTFHGSPLHNLALEAGAEVCRAHGARALVPMHLLLADAMQVDAAADTDAVKHIDDPATRQRLLDALSTDFHAGFFETSLTLHYAPESVSPRYKTLPACPTVVPDRTLLLMARAAAVAGQSVIAREFEFAAAGKGWGNLRPYYGYTSEPAHAAASAGRFFADYIVERFATAVCDVFDRNAPPPQPVMRWVEPMSLNGRLSGNHLSMRDVFGG
jgi:creatinine amidohydrolase